MKSNFISQICLVIIDSHQGFFETIPIRVVNTSQKNTQIRILLAIFTIFFMKIEHNNTGHRFIDITVKLDSYLLMRDVCVEDLSIDG